MKVDPIKRLVEQLSRLPGVGERTAMRLTLHLISKDIHHVENLVQSLQEVRERVHECASCCGLTCDEELCDICVSSNRDRGVICIVASVQDQMAIENTGEFKGLYHVLHGTLAPMDGVGPKEIRIGSLMNRLADNQDAIHEIIIATPPTIEGEATGIYIAELVNQFAIPISRIASGVPVGGDLQFADRLTIARAMHLRRGV